MNGFTIADNSKYKYKQKKSNNKFFITLNENIIDNEEFSEYNPVYALSLKGIFLQIRAEKVYFTHGIYDFIPCFIWGAEKHNLWHGVPLKEIGPNSDWSENSQIIFLLKKIIYKTLKPLYYMSCDYVYCPFTELIPSYKRFFCISKPSIIIEKQARNTYKKHTYKNRKILFAPTHRTLNYNENELNNLIKNLKIKEARDTIYKENHELIIRPHPIDLDFYLRSELSKIYTIDSSIDIYETIGSYEFIITDYSSIYLDCLEQNLDCYLLITNTDDYKERVGLNDLYGNIINKTKKFDNLIYLLNNHYEK